MAKLLKFGVGYTPNKAVVNKKTGEKTVGNFVDLLIFMDGKNGPVAFPYLQNFLGNKVRISRDGETIYITVPEDKFETFINPSGKLLGRVLDTIEKATGYVADAKDISNLKHRYDVAKDEVANANRNGVAVVTNQYIKDLIRGLEKDLNDPRFKQIMDTIQIFGHNGFTSAAPQGNYNDDDVVLRETKLGVDNIIRILAQWNKAGRTGIPTYLATQNQWAKYFNGTVRQDALKLYGVRVDNVNAVSTSTVMRQLNIDPNKPNRSAAVNKGIASIKRGGGMDNWRQKHDSFALVCYYDVSDVDNVNPNDLTGNTANYYDPNSVTADTTNADTADTSNDLVQNDTQQNDVVNKGTVMTEDILRKKLLKISEERNSPGIKLAIQRDGTLGGLIYMIEHLKEITRDRDADRKKATVEQVLFIILTQYNIFEDIRAQLLKKYISVLATPDKNVNQKLLIEMWSFASIILSMLDGVKEAYGSSLTLADVIRYLGFTIEDFKRMPKDENDAEARLNNVKESFIRTFNKLLIK